MTRTAQTSLLALSFAAGTAHAAVLEVPGQFSSIATAVQFAQPGDTIRVQANFINSTELIDLQGKAITIESTSSFQFNGGLILLADGGEVRGSPQGGQFGAFQAELRVPSNASATVRAYQGEIELGTVSVASNGHADLISENVVAQLGFNFDTSVGAMTLSPGASSSITSNLVLGAGFLMPGSTLTASRISAGSLIANGATINALAPSFGAGDDVITIDACCGDPTGWTLSESSVFSAGNLRVSEEHRLSAFDSELFLGADLVIDSQATGQFAGSFVSANDVMIHNVATLDLTEAVISARDIMNQANVPGGVIGSGEWTTRSFINDGPLTLTGDTLLTGAVENNGTITVQVGTLTIAGSFTDNGTVLGDLVGPLGGGMAVTGDYEAGAGATLAMPSSDLALSVNGSFDVAIDDTARFDLDDASLAIGGLAGATLEAMSLDVGPFEDGLDGSRTGAFPVGSLTIRGTVDLVDAHPNSGSLGPESIYADALTIESGATLNTNGIVVYYRTLSLDGAVDNPANLVPIEAGGVCLGDCDGNGTVDFNDLVAMLFEFGNATAPCDADGSGVVDFNDLVAALFLFGPCD